MMIAFGISSLFFAILGVVIPFFGIFISGLSGFVAWMSAGRGTPLGAAAVIINLANLFLLSPGYLIVTSVEAQMRTPEQSRMAIIWMFVLFIQISAIGVFFINFLLSHIEFRKLSGKNRAKKTSEGPSLPELTPSHEPTSTPGGAPLPSSGTDEIITPPSLSQALTYGTHPRMKQGRGSRRSGYAQRRRDLEDIPFDGSRPHAAFLHQNRSFYKAYSMVVTAVLFIFVIVYLRPDLFPFLDYAAVYRVFSKTFPEKYLDMFQKKQKESQLSTDISRNQLHRRPLAQSEPTKSDLSRQALPQTQIDPVASNYWYIIELKDGETILTQDAVITRDYVSVMYRNGEEKRINKIEVKKYARKKLD